MKIQEIHCPYCGGTVKINVGTGRNTFFCLHCGEEIILPDEIVEDVETTENEIDYADDSKQLRCKNCGISLKTTDEYCPNCGVVTGKKPIVPINGFDKNIPIIGGSLSSIGIGGIIIIIIAIVLWFKVFA